VPSFYCRMLRLFLAVSLGLLGITISTIWPGAAAGWMDVVGVATLSIAMLGVGAWSLGAWLNDQY